LRALVLRPLLILRRPLSLKLLIQLRALQPPPLFQIRSHHILYEDADTQTLDEFDGRLFAADRAAVADCNRLDQTRLTPVVAAG
jgi:hypothetical protein